MATRISEKQLEAAKRWKGAAAGNKRDQFWVAEEVEFGDLPSQITPLIRRTLVDNYKQVDTTWDKFTTKYLANSIDVDEQIMTFNILDQTGIAGTNAGDSFIAGGLPRIQFGQKYQEIGMVGSNKLIRVSPFGEAFTETWATVVNTRGQSVRVFDQAIKAFGQHAAATPDIAAQSLLLSGSAINAVTFAGATTGVGGNHLNTDPALTSIFDIWAAVRQAQTFYIDQVNVFFDKFALVVAPSQVANAKRVLSTTEITSVGATAARAPLYSQKIDLGAEIEVVGARFFTAANLGGAALGSTAWFLVPISGGPKPSLFTGFLDGYEVPQYFVKTSNATTLDGGDSPYLDGDFDSDGISSKVRHVTGAAAGWTEGIIYSAGTGTGLTSFNIP
jgi:hypothetical protein